MPHVIVKLWPGKSEQQKTRLADEITKNVMEVLHYGEESVSVAFEEINVGHLVAELPLQEIQQMRFESVLSLPLNEGW